eukprot:11551346-Alexandrium_andersonii.AAC.1
MFEASAGGARVADPIESRTFSDDQADECLLHVHHLGQSPASDTTPTTITTASLGHDSVSPLNAALA